MVFDTEKRTALLFPKGEAKRMETAADLLQIQGFIDGRPGQYFRVVDIVNETHIPEAVIYRLLQFCEHFQKVPNHKGVYLSIAEVSQATPEGLEELKRMMEESALGREARSDWFWLIWYRNQERKRKSGAVTQKF